MEDNREEGKTGTSIHDASMSQIMLDEDDEEEE